MTNSPRDKRRELYSRIADASDRMVRRWVAAGRGEAILYFQSNRGPATDDLIFKLCQKCQEFDGLEDRSEYLWEIVTLANDSELLLRRLVRAMTFSRDEDNRASMLRILSHAYWAGNAWLEVPILRAIRTRKSAYEIYQACEWVGVNGLRMALQYRRILEDWHLFSAYCDLERQLGKRRAGTTIKRLCRELRIPFEEVKAEIEPRESEREPIGDPVQSLLDGKFVPLKVLQALREEDWKQLGDVILSSTDPDQIYRTGKAFRRAKRPLALDVNDLLTLLRAPMESRSWWVLGMVAAEITDERIRAYGLELMQSSSPEEYRIGVEMLRKNLVSGDWELIADSVYRRRLSDEGFHTLAVGLLQFDPPPPSFLLRYFFKRLRCELCRGHIVEMLGKRKELSQDDLLALQFDSNPGTRQYARKRLQSMTGARR